MNGQTEADRDLIAELGERYVATLEQVLAGSKRVALVDFPHHENVGDSAIWLGERVALGRLGCDVVHVGEIARHDAAGLRRRLGNGTVLLHGGGNLGDLWPQHQAFREQVLVELREHRVVLLAQSMQFNDASSAARVAACFDAHPALTILARDAGTLERARSQWATPTVVCPDAAFLLDLRARRARTEDVLWLLRTDHEAAQLHGGASVDWLHAASRSDPSRWVEDVLEAALQVATAVERRVGRRSQVALPAVFDAMARSNLRRGTRLLSRGRVVVTDRLHGHILCLLLGVPHVLLADGNGKVRAFYDTWTSRSHLAHWADSPTQAASLARELVAA